MSEVYLVTGCSTGLGYQLCKAILAAGHTPIATSRSSSKTPDIVAEIQGTGGHWGQLDVTSSDVASKFQELIKVHGRVDVLINNAAIAIGCTVEHTDMDIARMLFRHEFLRRHEVDRARHTAYALARRWHKSQYLEWNYPESRSNGRGVYSQ